MSMSKYFVVDDRNLADVMSALTGERYYIMSYKEGVKYSFIRSENISHIYGKAKRILENLNNK